MRALFSYDPEEDSRQPCQEAGLKFSTRDVLSVVNMDDHYWWQAAQFGKERIQVGLIPSTLMRERYVKECDGRGRRRGGESCCYVIISWYVFCVCLKEWFNKIQQGRKQKGRKVAYSPLQGEEQWQQV